MRALVSLATGLLTVWAAAPEAAQTPALQPNFSGQWTLDASRFTGSGAHPRSVTFGRGAGQVPAPTKTKDVPPVFPASARSKGISGSVLLEAVIDKNGEVADVRVVRSVQDFDQAAIDAVSQWLYTPTVTNGAPTEVVMVVTVNFATNRSSPAQGTAAPVPSPNGFGSGMWHGYVPVSLAISQDARKLTVVRQSQVASDKLTYGLDGKPSKNKLPHAGVARGDTYTYTSHWDGPQLVTDITWMDPSGLRELKETFSLEGDTLLVTTTRSDQSTGAVAFTQTAAYTRQK